MVSARIYVDHGSELVYKNLDRWANENNVTLDFSRPEKLTDNPQRIVQREFSRLILEGKLVPFFGRCY